MGIVRYLTDRGWTIEDGDFEQGYLEALRDSTYLLFSFTSRIAYLSLSGFTCNEDGDLFVDHGQWATTFRLPPIDQIGAVFYALYEDAVNQGEVHYVGNI